MPNLSQNGCSVWVTSSTELIQTPTAVALGKFDGVHRGHQRVIQPILHKSADTERIYPTVITFLPHPQEFFTGKTRTLLTPLDEKVRQLELLGVEQLVLIPFNKELSALTPEQFVEQIIVEKLQASRISVGQDFCFGSNRSGTTRDLQVLAAKYDIPVTIVPLETHEDDLPLQKDDTRISTSLIRQTLETGNIEQANRLLGRPYTLIGTVVKGQQLGRTIGFPTANLQLPEDKFLPQKGVYAVRVSEINQPDTTLTNRWGVMNIGNRPTVNGTYPTVEVHLLDWSGDLYNKKLQIQLEKFLRSEQKFDNLEALKSQIQLDCNTARKFFNRVC
ncbi:riboflavin kinase/FAD synthase [Calothrix parasitica NIES-267]|uniref:Riboflavin biosynthesis protein n=1 Tax=Calothrix parasitica NIES-267 TaxID=1973488 RepID=A0A1Z4M164_9CYAN|nr:riboflavin kinase/FAD synthase [Calothrix parasitica NIES-267]